MRFDLHLNETDLIEGIILFIILLILNNYYPYMQLNEHKHSQNATTILSFFTLISAFIIKLVLNDYDTIHTLIIIIFISNTIISLMHLKTGKCRYFWEIIAKENSEKFAVIFHYLITVISPAIYILTFIFFNIYSSIVQNIQILATVISVMSTMDGIYTGGDEDIDTGKEYRKGILYTIVIYILFFFFSINEYKANSEYGQRILFCALLFETALIAYVIFESIRCKQEKSEIQANYKTIIINQENEIEYLKKSLNKNEDK